MKSIIENFKHKSKIEKIWTIVIIVSAILLIGSSLVPLLYLQ